MRGSSIKKMQNKSKILVAVLLVALVISNAFFAYMYLKNTRALADATQKQQINKNVLSFTELFMTKVLQGSSVVSFDDRLQLENSVRALNDKDIFTSWTNFTNAKSQTETQQAFYALFNLLLKKLAL